MACVASNESQRALEYRADTQELMAPVRVYFLRHG